MLIFWTCVIAYTYEPAAYVYLSVSCLTLSLAVYYLYELVLYCNCKELHGNRFVNLSSIHVYLASLRQVIIFRDFTAFLTETCDIK